MPERTDTREVFLTPEAIMAQYYHQYKGPQSENPEIWYKSALQASRTIWPPARW